MGHPFKIAPLASLLLCFFAALTPASAEKRYPAFEDPWDATDYRALVQRIENNGLELPTLSNGETKPVFERMVDPNNIPQRMGKNKNLDITIRFQRLDPLLKPLQQLIVFYSVEIEKGKPYAKELTKIKICTLNASAAWLDILDPFVESLPKNKSYNAVVEDLNKAKINARELYLDVLKSVAMTNIYSKAEALEMTKSALDALPPYLSILTDEDKVGFVRMLSQQISTTNDPHLKTALTELRDAIKHGRIKT